MTIDLLLRDAKHLLKEHGIADFARSAEILLAHAIQKPILYLVSHHQEDVSEKQFECFIKYLDQRKKSKPIAYIIREKEFYSHSYYVDERVLIPRPETEILVDEVLAQLNKLQNEFPRVCDIGTGSGAIAISLKKMFPKAFVTATDISLGAIEVAKMNATKLHVDIEFIESDLLHSVESQFDVIVSNLPYIPSQDILKLTDDIQQFEPHLALDGGDQGLDLIRSLIEQAYDSLSSHGILALEFGDGQFSKVQKLMEEYAFKDIVMLRDLASIPRAIFGKKTINGT
ncbi:MAG: peptide chain release factor N(5)-glutamine methyltransferase [Bdellovibrionales bacterium]|nr:peptide chain release factor N(5)-glutamine methyltransferase [Bdellovibrionales bacterium]